MNEHYIQPDGNGFKDTILDDYLALGYHRMRNSLFTAQAVHNGYYGKSRMMMVVFWLRTVVNKIIENKTTNSIRKKCAGFKVVYKEAVITEEIEKLFSLYSKLVDFEISEKCSDYFDNNLSENPFDSRMIEVRDGTKLIAVGYFDKGKNAIMGILNIYHPDYRKFSLGKFLILHKIDYALANNIAYYYTGYISTENIKYDYKLFPDVNAVEVYMPVEKRWDPVILYDKPRLATYFEENYIEPLFSSAKKSGDTT